MTVLSRRLATLAAFSLLALALSACSGVKPSLTAPPPGAQPFRTASRTELSTINVPIEASSEELSRVLNKVLRKDLYKGSTKTSGLSADIVRNGPVAVSASDNFLNFSVPISLSLSYAGFTSPPLPVKLRFRASAKVSPDWKLSTEVYYLGLSDLFAEQIGIGPISLKPRGIVEGLTQPLQRLLSEQITKNLNELFPLKAQVDKVWNAAQKPILIDSRYQAWLKLSPREITLSPVQVGNNRVTLSLGVTSVTELVVGPEPAAQAAVPLPPLKLVSSVERNFRVALYADLFYQDLVKIASPLLLNKEFSSDGRTVVLKDLQLYGNGDRFVIRVATTGALEGIFYLTGKPHFDPATNVFSVREVDFDMQTESLLLQSADWFLHGTIKDRIQEKLNLDLTQKVEQSRDLAGKAVSQRQLAEHLVLKGSLKSLKINDPLVQQDRISIRVDAEGDSAVLFQ